jgi:hypothetical protein
MVARSRLLFALFAFAAWGQSSEKTFYFSHLDSPQAMQEVSNAVRMVTDSPDVSPDMAKRSLTVKGTEDQLAAAAWLSAEMDKSGATGTRDYSFSDPKAPLVRVVYLNHLDSPRDLQEVVNGLRSVLDIQRCFPMSQQKAIVMRGPRSQVKAADWLLGVLDAPPGAGAASADYQLPDEGWSFSRNGELLVRVATLKNIDTPQAFQEVTAATRAVTDMGRMYPVFSRRCLVMRGTEDQIALAGSLLRQFDGPGGQGTKEFKVGGDASQMVQVAYVNAGPQSLHETAGAVRTETKMASVFDFQTQKALVMRGTAEQLAQAGQVIQSRLGR